MEARMAYRCFNCGKGPVAGKSVSHSKRATNRYFYPNLARRKVLVGNAPKTEYVCSICLKSNKVQIA